MTTDLAERYRKALEEIAYGEVPADRAVAEWQNAVARAALTVDPSPQPATVSVAPKNDSMTTSQSEGV